MITCYQFYYHFVHYPRQLFPSLRRHYPQSIRILEHIFFSFLSPAFGVDEDVLFSALSPYHAPPELLRLPFARRSFGRIGFCFLRRFRGFCNLSLNTLLGTVESPVSVEDAGVTFGSIGWAFTSCVLVGPAEGVRG